MLKPKGVDPRVNKLLNDDRGNWVELPFGFVRQRQHDPSRAGYQGTDAYNANDHYTINWKWLDDLGLVDKEGRYTKTEFEKQRGLDILKARVEAIAKDLCEV